ncbi:MAG: hypothetical protein LBD75_00295 [Candidatus Peribacteria bacterium]|nr:hypothetical protein [Candidatus Peribacteria bacterium]
MIGKSDAKEMANLVKNTLIAGVLIQSSWFLMAAAVDISTIATYGIGGLPLSITGKATNEKDTKVTYLPNITVFVPVEDGTAAPVLFLGTESYTGEDKKRYTGRNISPCAIVTLDDGGKKEELIIGRAYINYSNKDKVLAETNEKICHYWGSVYRFKQEPIFLPPSDIRGGIDKSIITGQTAYNKEMGDFKGVFTPTKKENIKSMISEGKILQIVEGFQSRVFTGDGAGGAIPTTGTSKEPWGFDREYTWLRTQPGVQLTTLSNLLEKSKSYVGVFSALYESMINAGEITFSEKAATDGFFKSFLQTAYNVLYVAVLLLPLAVLAIVLMARVAILRVVIAASPIIILLHVFKKDIKVEAITGDKSDFALKNIGSLLLAPVLISFALSLSTVFMSILRQLKYGEEKGLPTNILGLFEVDIQGTGVDISKVLINVMGIGIVRFLLFRAIKQNQIGKAV